MAKPQTSINIIFNFVTCSSIISCQRWRKTIFQKTISEENFYLNCKSFPLFFFPFFQLPVYSTIIKDDLYIRELGNIYLFFRTLILYGPLETQTRYKLKNNFSIWCSIILFYYERVVILHKLKRIFKFMLSKIQLKYFFFLSKTV